MKRLFLAVLLGTAVAPAADDDPVLRAMRDELERSRKLSIEGLADKPYYIEYTLEDVHAFTASASLGALVGSSENRFRVPRVSVRVGDYSFDNTNYVLSDYYSGSRYDGDRLPLDDDYAALRRGFWLATDRAYKTAVEAISRKRAALRNVTQTAALPDFFKAPVLQKLEPPLPAAAPASWRAWPDRVRSLSAVFLKYPEILASSVAFSSTRSTYRMHNSEGTTIRRPEPLAHLIVQASAQAADGTTVRDAESLPHNDENELPPQEELIDRVARVADNVRALAKAPPGESYAGPVLFEGAAGAQVMAELLTPNLAPGRRPVGEPGRPAPFLPSEFEGRLESRVLPEFLDVIDDPSQERWSGGPLLGHYETDEEGVVPAPLVLIEKGRLKRFVTTRQPLKGFDASNGRARMPGAFGARSASVGNLFVKSSETVSGGDLKKKLIELAQARNKPYGILVRKMDFPSSAPPEELRRLMAAAGQSGSARVVSAPVLAYKVYPDGREELIRGVRFRAFSARSLRDILAVSDTMHAVHYLNNMAPMALIGAGGYVAPVSVVAPSLLFDELELERPQDDTPNLPLVPPPALSGAE